MVGDLVILIVCKLPKLKEIIFRVYRMQLEGNVINHNVAVIQQSCPKILLNAKSRFSPIDTEINHLIHNIHRYLYV